MREALKIVAPSSEIVRRGMAVIVVPLTERLVMMPSSPSAAIRLPQ
jgi:hypothetical protein